VARRRSDDDWQGLSEPYRRRLERSGITRSRYLAGGPLARARGHVSPEHERATQTESRLWTDIQKFGPKDELNNSIISRQDLREVIEQYGYQAVRDRIAQLKQDARAYDQGEYPYRRGDGTTDPDYLRLASEDDHGSFAHFYWYHGPILP
jgi:hypothetical protein